MWLLKFPKALHHLSLKSSDLNLGNGYTTVHVWETYVLRRKHLTLGVNPQEKRKKFTTKIKLE